jgi:hypothetical protein
LTVAELEQRACRRRAVEAVIWGMPAVNFELMYRAMVDELGGGDNQIVYWSRLFDWKNQTLTPNPDTIYLLAFFNTTDGPVVLEIPPADGGSITGTIMDAWQCALEDVGPAGVDKGDGGKYLVLPPGYDSDVPAGYIALASDTHAGYALLRSNLRSSGDSDVTDAVVYARRVGLYPMVQEQDPPATTFLDAIDVIYDATIPYDGRFFESLDRFVQAEPWLERDNAMSYQLASIGIEKGKPFAPDADTRRILDEAAAEAHAWLDARYGDVFAAAFYDGGRWAVPISRDVIEGQQTFYARPDVYPVDARGVTFSYAFFTPKHGGVGQFYLMTINDAAGQPFVGASTYRLNVPTDAPVELYWSVTIYDRATHALIRDMPWASRSSLTPGLRHNDDGSVDVYFGPRAPDGNEANWIPTNPTGGFEVLCRFYGPKPPLMDKTWRLPDIHGSS